MFLDDDDDDGCRTGRGLLSTPRAFACRVFYYEQCKHCGNNGNRIIETTRDYPNEIRSNASTVIAPYEDIFAYRVHTHGTCSVRYVTNYKQTKWIVPHAHVAKNIPKTISAKPVSWVRDMETGGQLERCARIASGQSVPSRSECERTLKKRTALIAMKYHQHLHTSIVYMLHNVTLHTTSCME